MAGDTNKISGQNSVMMKIGIIISVISLLGLRALINPPIKEHTNTDIGNEIRSQL